MHITTTQFIIAQVFGLVALVANVLICQAEKRKQMLGLQLIVNLAYLMNYVLLGALTGAAMCIVCSFRAIIFGKLDKENRPTWPFVVMLVVVIATGIITWQGIISLLATVGVVMTTITYWQRDPQSVRKFSLISSPLWMLYNLFSLSITGFLTELLATLSALVGFARFRKKPRAAKLAVESETAL